MTMSLHDHHRRLGDLEAALVALIESVTRNEAAKRGALRDAAHQLRVRGQRGAAGLLEGTPSEAAYRRG